MRNTFTFITAAAVLALGACSNSEDFEQSAQQSSKVIKLTLNATRGEVEASTRTTISYNDEYASLESTWNAGDKIYVYSRKTGEKIGCLEQTGTIVNQRTAPTSQYPTSYAQFSGEVELGVDDTNTDDFAFVYQGAVSEKTPTNGLLKYTIGTSENVAGLNAWDVAYATGKIQNTTDLEHASCAVNFTNKVAFGYFTTTGCEGTNGVITVNYYNKFTLDVKTGTISGTSGTIDIPANSVGFYMTLLPGLVQMSTANKWSQKEGKLGYETIKQQKSFSAVAGNYYRLGRASSFAPVPFQHIDWKNYETLKNSKFNVSADKEVYFTQGNLQYIGSADEPYWRVALDQYSYLGNANAIPANANAGTTFTGDVDLFGWGEITSPFHGSTDTGDYQSSTTDANGNLTTDWATKFNDNTATLKADASQNYPSNGAAYYCLTNSDLEYLFNNQYWGYATVNMVDGRTVKGIVVYPNSVTNTPEYGSGNWHKGCTYTPTGGFAENTIDQATIDGAGLLFLPAAGSRSGVKISDVGTYCGYWSATSANNTTAYRIRCLASAFAISSGAKSNGFSVRLAQLVTTTP